MSLTELTGNPRHDQLLTLIADRGYMNIDELAQLLDVSTQTVRRDIRKLSEQGLITRHHGGAGRASSVVNTPTASSSSPIRLNQYLPCLSKCFGVGGTPDGGLGSFLLIGRLDGFPFTKARGVGVFGGPGIIENSY